LKKHGTTVYTALTDIEHIIEDIIVEGNKVVVRMTIRWTHSGEFMGIPPTGVQATWTGISIGRFAGAVSSWKAGTTGTL
jgi:predicted ester cyclase